MTFSDNAGGFVSSKLGKLGKSAVSALTKGDDVTKAANKGVEQVLDTVKSYEQARNQAFDIIGDIGADSKPFIGRLGTGEGKIVGRQSADGKVRWRLDYDPEKGPHINVEDYRYGKGADAIKIAIPFEGSIDNIESLLMHLNK